MYASLFQSGRIHSDAEPDPERFGVPDALRLPLRLRSEPLPECALPLRDRDRERDEREPDESKYTETLDEHSDCYKMFTFI